MELFLPPQLVKAILLNTADDVGSKGIDFPTGFGAANAYKALLEITNAHSIERKHFEWKYRCF
jgi:hypothetical protein